MRIREVIVVEGKNDTHKVKQAVEADTIETQGAGMTQETIAKIKLAQKKRGVIVLTDPDFAGEQLRRRINHYVPGCKHAYISKYQALPGRIGSSVGVEHATIEAIREALRNVQTMETAKKSDITKKDLLKYNLIGTPEAKERRERLGERLHIGYANGKQLLQRLHLFNISRNELKEAMMHILERGKEHD
ncbi:MAG TPA: ribonuclease M5 [Pseudogracilibacillus sp.]|nr:ribonuclease M5 [Pseudogracilibacillus sp.]